MRIAVDTNVVVSALVFGGIPRQILDLGPLGVCQLCFSPATRRELERILADKFGWGIDEIHSRVAKVLSWGITVNPTTELSIVKDDPDDDRILECAMEAKAEAIVSGDRHLLKLGSFQGIPICTPRQFLEGLPRLCK
jgi:uncharacterized protein